MVVDGGFVGLPEARASLKDFETGMQETNASTGPGSEQYCLCTQCFVSHGRYVLYSLYVRHKKHKLARSLPETVQKRGPTIP